MKLKITTGTMLAMPLACIVAVILAAVLVMAQQVTGAPGSPSATRAIDEQQIPPPPPKFGGKIEGDFPDDRVQVPPPTFAKEGISIFWDTLPDESSS